MSEEYLLEKIEAQAEAQKDYQINSIRSKVPADRMSQEFCECGERIHVERRIRGYENCIECAIEIEKIQKSYARTY